MLFLNIVMDSLGSLALATELPEKELLNEKPVNDNAAIICPGMIRDITGSCVYSLIVLVLMMYSDVLCYTPSQIGVAKKMTYRITSMYNFFVFSQIFNMVPCRRFRN